MGEDFLRRRNDRFRRLRDEYFTKLVEEDLFSNADPQCITEVPGTVLPESVVAPGERVWGQPDRDHHAITFYRGDTPVVQVSERTAETLLGGRDADAGTLVGVVTAVDAANAIATMRLCDVTASR